MEKVLLSHFSFLCAKFEVKKKVVCCPLLVFGKLCRIGVFLAGFVFFVLVAVAVMDMFSLSRDLNRSTFCLFVDVFVY